jgi:RNA polymerase sigma factor (sigma-70 family)
MVNLLTVRPIFSDQELVRELQQGDKKAMEYLYGQYWPMIAHFVWLNHGQQEEAEDLFQEGIIILYEKLLNKDFILQYSLKSYLYGICRNHWLKGLRAKKIFTIRDSAEFLENIPEIREEEDAVLPDDEELELVMVQLKEPCHSLLIGFYYQRKSLEQLAKVLHYASPNVAKQMKFRCLERLRKILDHKGQY